MGSPSAIITLGLGTWGSPSLIVTLGYGSGAVVTPVNGPIWVAAAMVYRQGAMAASVYRDGMMAGESVT